MNFYAAIFDLDGVLADTAILHLKAWEKLLSDIGLKLPADAEHKTKGLERLASLDVLLGDNKNEFSQEKKLELATEKNQHYLDLISGLNKLDLLPGAEEILSNLKYNSISVGLASASKNATQVVKALGVHSYFNFIVDAALVEKSKPDPEIFLAAAKGLQVYPGNCVGFEDAPAGVESVIDAGMYAVGIGSDVELHKANVVFPSLKDFLSFESLKFSQHLISFDCNIRKENK